MNIITVPEICLYLNMHFGCLLNPKMQSRKSLKNNNMIRHHDSISALKHTYPHNVLIRCERVNRAASADHERGLPSDDSGALPGRSTGDYHRAPFQRRSRDRGARGSGCHAAPAARVSWSRHRDDHQVHLHRDHSDAGH